MHIISISNLPIHQIQYLTAASGGIGVIERYLPVLLAEVDSLPNNLEAITITSDLQGIDPKNQQLLGHLVIEELEKLAENGKIPSLKNTGIILAGDLYAEVNRRSGVVGDIREIWQAFHQQFCWVAGVRGNQGRGTTLLCPYNSLYLIKLQSAVNLQTIRRNLTID